MEKGLTTRWAKPATDYNIRKLVYRGTSTGSSFQTPLFHAARGSQCGLGLLSETTQSTYIVLALLFCFLGFFPLLVRLGLQRCCKVDITFFVKGWLFMVEGACVFSFFLRIICNV